MPFDAVLLLSFGGPDGPDDVMPFLANVLRGRPVPPERLEEVAAHYMRFGGRSPINEQNRVLADAIRSELAASGRPRPVYRGNRNWHPLLPDTLAAMRDDGVGRAAAFVTSAYSSYSGCRQYLDDLAEARRRVGPGAPEVVKLRPYHGDAGFVEPLADGLRTALADAGPGAPVLMSAHSIPSSMAAACRYEAQLAETAAAVAARVGLSAGGYQVVYQSRSGTPAQPWLDPDVGEAIAGLPPDATAVVVTPIGFVSDHMEVVYDLDVVAREAAEGRGLRFYRTATPGTDPRFVRMAVRLVDEAEATEAGSDQAGAPGSRRPAYCYEGCCPPPRRT